MSTHLQGAVVSLTGRCALSSAAVLLSVGAAIAGGSPENAILIIDPSDPTSMYVGNYYKHARNIPDSNVLYLRSAATSYQSFPQTNLPAFMAALDQQGVTDHADYAVLAPLDTYFVPATGLVSDSCFPVGEFSIGSVYTMGFISQEILNTHPTS